MEEDSRSNPQPDPEPASDEPDSTPGPPEIPPSQPPLQPPAPPKHEATPESEPPSDPSSQPTSPYLSQAANSGTPGLPASPIPNSASPYAAPQTGGGSVPNEEIRKYPFTFHGNGAEYFRIWIVNVALTVVTLGLYTPWARVRTRRYFYGNTFLNERNFTYLANPVALLKGFLIVVGGLIIYQVTGTINPLYALPVLAIFMGVFPWLIYKSLRFKAHNSAYSNVRLGFKGTCSESYAIYLGLALLVPFTLGLIIPYQAFRGKQYLFNHLTLGKSLSRTTIEPGRYYLYYLAYMIIGFVGTAAMFIFVFAIAATMATSMDELDFDEEDLDSILEEEVQDDPQASLLKIPGAILPGAYHAFQSAIVPQVVRAQIPLPQDLDDPAEEDADEEYPVGEFDPESAGFMAGFMAVYFLFLLSLFAVQQFIMVKTTNYTLCHTTLGSCRLYSDMRFRDVLGILAMNLLLIVITLGIYIPWAVVRFRKYRIEHMAVYAYGDLQEFVAAEEAEQSAIGDAAGDYFDFEIGF